MPFKPSDIGRFLLTLVAAAIVLGLLALRVTRYSPAPRPPPVAQGPPAIAQPARPVSVDCQAGPAAAARANAASLDALAWTPFGRPEVGWRTYAPLIAREIGTPCDPASPGFAAALGAWAAKADVDSSGVLTDVVFDKLRDELLLRRPFVAATAHGACPAPPAAEALATASEAESYGGKTVQLRAAALAAYRKLVDAARRADPRIGEDPQMLRLISGYRDPADEAARCAGGACNRRERATCSAHRTGLAFDLYLGHAPGERPDSSADANRLYMSRTPAYRWLVANAARFGFVNYPFEPWHWEWTGEAP